MQNLKIQFLKNPETPAAFRQRIGTYMEEDILPNCDPPLTPQEAEWYRSAERWEHLYALMDREEDPLRLALLFEEDEEIGFIAFVIYHSEDGKCFLTDYCIRSGRRSEGLGSACFRLFEKDAAALGAAYFALTVSNPLNRKFWQRQGFVQTSPNEYGQNVYVKVGENLTERKPEDPAGGV